MEGKEVDMTDKIGFVGLGNIGRPMAVNLVNDGFDLTVYDLYQPACEALAELGAKVSANAAEMGRSCKVICVCVRDDSDVEDVVCSEHGVFSTARPGTIVIIHSTVRRGTILKLADDGHKHEVPVLDVPITGGASGAEKRSLCYMFGGPTELLERCRPVLAVSASKIVHAGDVGMGIALKLCNNLMTYLAFVSIHEGARLAEATGLSLDLLKQVGSVNGVVTPQMMTFIEGRNLARAALDEESFRASFAGFASLGKKDLDAALDLAAELEIKLPGTSCTRGLIESVFLDEY